MVPYLNIYANIFYIFMCTNSTYEQEQRQVDKQNPHINSKMWYQTYVCIRYKQHIP